MVQRIMKSLLGTVFLLLFTIPVFSQQAAVQQAAKSSSLAGTLVKDGSGEPIRGAEVSLSRINNPASRLNTDDSATDQIAAVTDANGQFRFPSLVAGEYSLTIHKNGFHGFRGPNSRTWQEFLSVTLAAGQSITDLALTMQPGAVISGKVIDEGGEPMALAQVNALKWVYANHHRQLRPISNATTDDQGNYRLFALEPGRYVLRANVSGEGSPAKMHYAPTYFPDSNSPTEASPIVLRPGDQSSADFRMTRVHAAKISGHVSGSSPGSQIQIYLRNSQDEGVVVARAAGASVDRNGNFTIDGVLPGDYVLGALEFRGEGNDTPQHAEVPLRVDGSDIPNIGLALEEVGRASLQGTLRVDGANVTHPRLDSLRVGLLPAGDSTGTGDFVGNGGYAAVGRDGSIRIDKVSPGQYVVSITADGSGWEDFYTKNVQIGNRDVTDSVVNFNSSRVVPITITVGIDGAFVEGTVTDDNGKPVASATVIGVPDPALRNQFDLYQRGESDQNGHFRLRGIKPGSYSFYAWNTMDDESYMDPEFLRLYENARTDLTVSPTDHQTLPLKLIVTDE
jgi:protocatechuate 3,4-dioxygenase beta subunit